MKNIEKISTKLSEVLSWVAIVLITGAAFFGTYYFHFSAPIKALIWIGWLVFTLLFGFFTKQGKQVFVFGLEAKVELQKVVWPNRQETIQTTAIVMVMVTLTGFVLWSIDSSMLWAIGKITHLG
jgi:preprotein translocase subunit SecE